MKAIFYDRKNKREVTSEELKPTKLVHYLAVGDSDDDFIPTGRRLNPYSGEPMDENSFNQAKKEGWLTNAEEVFKDKEDPIEGYYDFSTWKEELTPRHLILQETLLATLFYKSENCPKYLNGDLYTNENDLVFIRLE